MQKKTIHFQCRTCMRPLVTEENAIVCPACGTLNEIPQQPRQLKLSPEEKEEMFNDLLTRYADLLKRLAEDD